VSSLPKWPSFGRVRLTQAERNCSASEEIAVSGFRPINVEEQLARVIEPEDLPYIRPSREKLVELRNELLQLQRKSEKSETELYVEAGFEFSEDAPAFEGLVETTVFDPESDQWNYKRAYSFDQRCYYRYDQFKFKGSLDSLTKFASLATDVMECVDYLLPNLTDLICVDLSGNEEPLLLPYLLQHHEGAPRWLCVLFALAWQFPLPELRTDQWVDEEQEPYTKFVPVRVLCLPVKARLCHDVFTCTATAIRLIDRHYLSGLAGDADANSAQVPQPSEVESEAESESAANESGKRTRKGPYEKLYALHDELREENQDITDADILRSYAQRYSRENQPNDRTLENYRASKKKKR
jgi:hypothetical protein